MAVNTNGNRKILIFFIPHDLSIALEVAVEQYTVRPQITAVLGGRLAQLQQDKECEVYQRKQTETAKQLLARVFTIKPKEVFRNPIAYAVLQDIETRTSRLDLTGRGK